MEKIIDDFGNEIYYSTKSNTTINDPIDLKSMTKEERVCVFGFDVAELNDSCKVGYFYWDDKEKCFIGKDS